MLTLSDLRSAFFGAQDQTVSDGEYQQLLEAVANGATLGQLVASAPPGSAAPVGVVSGCSSLPRYACTSSGLNQTNQNLFLSYFTAPRSFTAAQVRLVGGSTPAGALPGLVRWGLYEVSAAGDITLVASIASDTSIFSVANTEYLRPITVPFPVVAGRRYASGILVATAATAPSVVGVAAPAGLSDGNKRLPSSATAVTGQADLPASVLFAGIAGTVNKHYAEILP